MWEVVPSSTISPVSWMSRSLNAQSVAPSQAPPRLPFLPHVASLCVSRRQPKHQATCPRPLARWRLAPHSKHTISASSLPRSLGLVSGRRLPTLPWIFRLSLEPAALILSVSSKRLNSVLKSWWLCVRWVWRMAGNSQAALSRPQPQAESPFSVSPALRRAIRVVSALLM